MLCDAGHHLHLTERDDVRLRGVTGDPTEVPRVDPRSVQSDSHLVRVSRKNVERIQRGGKRRNHSRQEVL
jgi:hypothetical protein